MGFITNKHNLGGPYCRETDRFLSRTHEEFYQPIMVVFDFPMLIQDTMHISMLHIFFPRVVYTYFPCMSYKCIIYDIYMIIYVYIHIDVRRCNVIIWHTVDTYIFAPL